MVSVADDLNLEAASIERLSNVWGSEGASKWRVADGARCSLWKTFYVFTFMFQAIGKVQRWGYSKVEYHAQRQKAQTDEALKAELLLEAPVVEFWR